MNQLKKFLGRGGTKDDSSAQSSQINRSQTSINSGGEIVTTATLQRRNTAPISKSSNSMSQSAAAAGSGASTKGKKDDSDGLVEHSTTLNTDDVNKYDITQVYTVELPADRRHEAKYETIDDYDTSDSASFEIDERLLDNDMLIADKEEVDRIYKELKERALKQKRKDIHDREIEDAIEIDEDEFSDSESGSTEAFSGTTEKILSLLERYNKTEREDFTNSLPNYANKKDKRQIDSLMPVLNVLADDEAPEVRKALLNQFIGLVCLI
jgi:hypothetical protein